MTRGYILHPPTETKARQWTAALKAASISCQLDRDPEKPERSVILIPERAIDAATQELACYEASNCNWPPGPDKISQAGGSRGLSPLKKEINEFLPVIAAGLLLPAWHITLHLQNRSDAFTLLGAATRHLMIDQGEWWRAVTALTLHVDASHVTGNTVWGILLGCGLALQIGAGGALLLGLLSGIGGNLLATWIGEAPRSAIGASTAVLGLVGLLAGLRFLQKIREPVNSASATGLRRQSWRALVAGLAGLAIFGSAEHTDLTGHLAGFVCGILLSPIALWINKNPSRQSRQLFMLTGYILILAAAWLTAISHLE